HKSQGSEFPAVVIPLAMQQYLLLQRNLVYTGITRGKKLVVVVGQRKALAMAVRNNKTAEILGVAGAAQGWRGFAANMRILGGDPGTTVEKTDSASSTNDAVGARSSATRRPFQLH